MRPGKMLRHAESALMRTTWPMPPHGWRAGTSPGPRPTSTSGLCMATSCSTIKDIEIPSPFIGWWKPCIGLMLFGIGRIRRPFAGSRFRRAVRPVEPGSRITWRYSDRVSRRETVHNGRIRQAIIMIKVGSIEPALIMILPTIPAISPSRRWTTPTVYSWSLNLVSNRRPPLLDDHLQALSILSFTHAFQCDTKTAGDTQRDIGT